MPTQFAEAASSYQRGGSFPALADSRVYTLPGRASAMSAPAVPWLASGFRGWLSAVAPIKMTVDLTNLNVPGCRLNGSIAVSLEQDADGSWVASDEAFFVYGDGVTASGALQDYIASLIDFYELVRARADRSPEDRVLWQRLERILSPVTLP